MAKKRKTSTLTTASSNAKIPSVNRTKIKELRVSLGMSQAVAATAAGFKSPIQWWDIENKEGRDPRVSTLAAVAKVLGCKVDDLLTR